MFSPIRPTSAVRVVSTVPPASGSADSAATSAGFFATTSAARSFANRMKSSFFATKSVSELTSTSTPTFALEKAREAGKPEAMLEKIAEGTVQKYLKEVTLLGQVFVRAEDGKQTVEQLLKASGARVDDFVLYVVGEGIEKKQSDFAAEVAAAAAARG